MSKLRFAAVLLLMSTLLTALGVAQTSSATLGGTVSDSTGALIPGVSITATNTQTGIVTTVISNEAGAYQFASLQPGSYKVTGELSGFQTQVYNNVALGISQQVRLNFALQVGGVAQSVEVTVAADTLLATSSSSVGSVLPDSKIRDLPLAYRNALDLVSTTPGTQASAGTAGVTVVGNFAGGRIGQVNTTRDGISVSDGRYDNGIYSATYVSQDLVDEVRVIVAPADAETGRGSGQVQLSTRSGTNQFKGSVFWANHNSVLDANNWFSNFRGVQPDYLNRNQVGGRLGGPIVKNKTFFFVLYEGQRIAQRRSVVGNVLTDQARQGIFRYFPGVQNGNAIATTPTVDLFGNPLKPAGATGDLSQFNVFTRDTLRPGPDTSGWLQTLMNRMPHPNDYTVGDGLNTAGFRWVRHEDGTETSQGTGTDVNRNQINFRIDHNFSSKHKASFSTSVEHVYDGVEKAVWPGGFDSENLRDPRTFTGSLTSTLSPTLVNEFRIGKRLNTYVLNAQFDNTKTGKDVLNILPTASGMTYVPLTQLMNGNFINYGLGSRGQLNSLYSYADNLSWIKGKHAFKGGAEFRFGYTLSMQAGNFYPVVTLGAGGSAVTGIDGSINGLVANNQTVARQLLTDLAGSVASIQQAFFMNDSKDLRFIAGPEQSGTTWDTRGKLRELHQNEWSAFFKDDWKVRQDLTLNVGMRYEYYGVPWDAHGLAGHLIGGGTEGVFGISGKSFADMYQPGHLAGSQTLVEFVGKNSPNPNTQLYADDYNNFAPAVGLSWSVPYWGKDRTVVRAGYGMSYQGGGRSFTLDGIVGGVPGVAYSNTFTSANLISLGNFSLPLSRITPLQPAPLTERTQTLSTFEDKMSTPYIQNWNLELQHQIANNFTVEARYIGSKGTKLIGGIPINIANIFENGILDAFNVTRAGGNAPLFDKMLNGLNLGSGVINGSTVTGSASLRNNTTFKTFLANGSVGQFAQTLNNSTTITNVAGGLVRNGGFPENFIVANPQFNGVTLNGNPSNSTYHSLQLQLTKRLSHGFQNSFAYTFSRTMGENDNDAALNYLNDRNRSTMKSLLGFHRTHDFRSNGTYELPFGPNRPFLKTAPGWLTRIVERWQLGGIFSFSSGAPLTITAATSTFNQFTTGTPMIVGNLPKSTGSVTEQPGGVVNYFAGLKQIQDPAYNSVTPNQTLQSSFSNFAIADANGNPILVNPAPGTLGNLGLRWIEGPKSLNLDMNLVKRIKIQESKEFEMRIDAINILNHPLFANPTLNIDSTAFGRITTATGARTFVLNARVNF
jgi:Carboxypeptidase regulatory-like domain